MEKADTESKYRTVRLPWVIAFYHHARYGTVKMRLPSESHAARYAGNGWRYVGSEGLYARHKR